MDSGNAILMLKALDGLAARATVTAQNVANAGTPNYRPLRVSFEQALRVAAEQGDEAIAQVSPTIDRVPSDSTSASTGGGVRLDLELGDGATTALRYGALIGLLGREMQIEALAIRGNS